MSAQSRTPNMRSRAWLGSTCGLTVFDMTLLYVTATPNPENPEAMEAYTGPALKLLTAAGGEPLTRAKITDAIVGQPTAAMFLAMKFPSAEAIQSVFGSAEYKKLVPTRDKAFAQLTISIAEAM